MPQIKFNYGVWFNTDGSLDNTIPKLSKDVKDIDLMTIEISFNIPDNSDIIHYKWLHSCDPIITGNDEEGTEWLIEKLRRRVREEMVLITNEFADYFLGNELVRE